MLRRVVVFQEDSDEEPIALVNPAIVERSGESSTDDEGCLSLQGVLVPVERSCSGHRRGQGRDGRRRAARARGAGRPGRAARARPPRRRADHRPHDARGAARGARRAAARGSRSVRIGVAATAPFGADVLERLADDHDIAFLLTRPDRPRGRGRRPGPPPAKEVAERLGIPVLQPERLTAEVELDADTIVVAAYGVLIPSVLLDRALWLNVHPSLLPRWRGAAPVERAIMAGDRETGVTIHRTTPELDAGPIAAQRAFPIEPDDDAGAVYATRRAGRRRAARRSCSRSRRSGRSPTRARPTPRRSRPADRELDWSLPAEEVVNRVRALSPHIGARAELNGRPVIVWRARVADGRAEPVEVQPDGGRRMSYEAFLRGPAVTPPARRAAYEVMRRVFEQDAYADRALAAAAEGLDQRDRALAQRLAYGAVQRVRTLDHAIEALGRRPVAQARPAGARGAAAGRLPARLRRRRRRAYAAVERVGGARPRARGSSARCRSRTRSCGASRDGIAAAARGAARRGRSSTRTRTGSTTLWRRDLGEEEALALMRAQNEPPETVVRLVRGELDGEPTGRARRVPRRARRRAGARRGPDLAAEPRVAARGARRRRARRRADARPAARRRAARRRCSPARSIAVELHAGRARELRENARRLGATNVTRREADGLALPPELTGFDRALVDAPCSGLGVLARRPDLRWRAKPLPELQLALLRAAAERVRPGGTVVYAVCTINARRERGGRRRVRPRARPAARRRVAAVPASARPEFLLTLPHLHGTSGFFVARSSRRP